ncbi:hypothetical protein FQR65_LT11714 [Abscondita terminalis]|nr:hypothetical protein FQR65_LT11714 [Abscondita terminalis]
MNYELNTLSPFQIFRPYINNGGTIVAIAGEDYAIIGSDTRLSSDHIVITTHANKLFELSNKSVLGCTGCWCDVLTFTRIVNSRICLYKHQNNKVMSTEAIAQMLSTILYFKRFFPYYVSNILAGLDSNGKGCVFNYDPIGHYVQTQYEADGTGGSFATSILDNKVGLKNMVNVDNKTLDVEDALALLKDVFTVVAERDVFTGDCVSIDVITEGGIERSNFQLRSD